MPGKKEAPLAKKRVDFLDDDDDDDDNEQQHQHDASEPVLRVNEGFAKRLEVRERREKALNAASQ